MPRPKTKEELISAANGEYQKMWDLIGSMPEEERTATFRFEDRDRNLRDILVHLYEWHQLLLNWVRDNQNGIPSPFLPPPYNWKTYGDMNVEVIWKKHQATPYEEAVRLLNGSHREAVEMIETFRNDELFTKKHYPWTGSTSLGSYCISATSSHYDWAVKKIKNHIKTYGAKG